MNYFFKKSGRIFEYFVVSSTLVRIVKISFKLDGSPQSYRVIFMEIVFEQLKSLPDVDAIVIFLKDELKLSGGQLDLDKDYNGVVSNFLKTQKVLDGKFGKVHTITANESARTKYIVLVTIGNERELEQYKVRELGGKIFAHLAALKIAQCQVPIDASYNNIDKSSFASLIAAGMRMSSYKFDKYRTKKDEQDTVLKATIALDNYKHAAELYESSESPVIDGIFFARDLISEPPNVLYPDSYAAMIVDTLEDLGVTVEVIGEREMRNLGMGALLGVGQGSVHESKLVVMQYNGALTEDEAPVAFVGKGVTFDTGGISIKPSLNMWDMKYDMAGSAAVVGTIMALAQRKAKINAVGVVGLVENMPGGNAQRPSDVVTTMSGKTVEVLDTDAEGRLVLSDALWYTQSKFKPQFMVDLATLTGAITVALGSTYAGCFSNNDTLAEKLIVSGGKVDEKLWRMPLHNDYDEMIKSDIADIANIGNVRGAAGSSTAAQFLQKFVDDVPWAHLDIAGVAWNRKQTAICPKGAVGFGIMLLNQLIKDYYEAAH